MKFQLSSVYKPTGDQPKAIDKLVRGIASEGKKHQVLLGVTGSGKTFTVANVIEKLQKPTLIISHNKTLAAQLYQEFREFFPKNAVQYFVSYYDYYQPEAYIPQRDLYIEKDAQINDEIDKLRLAASTSLMTREDTIVVASVSAIYNLGSPEAYKKAMVLINVGDKYSSFDLQHDLVNLFYERNDIDFKRGTFRVRGNNLDVYISYADIALRFVFDGDVITRCDMFNPIDGTIITNYDYYIDMLVAFTGDKIERVVLYPAKHYVTDAEEREKGIAQIVIDLEKRLQELKSQSKEIEAYRLQQKVNYDIEMMREVGYCKGIENYSRYFDGRNTGDAPLSLLEYFPDDYLLVLDESHITIPQVRGMYNGDRSRKQTLVDYGFRLPSALDNRPLKFDEFEQRMGNTIYLSATPEQYELEKAGKEGIAEQLIRPTGLIDPVIEVRPAENQIKDLIVEIKDTISKGFRVLVTTLTKRMAEDLSEYLKQENVRVTYLHSDIETLERSDILTNLRKGEYDVLVGINLLREGLDLPEVALVAILDADKEGFLRSRTSLIQTMGRAARHVEGRVLLYADNRTRSLEQAIYEVERRRKIQIEYNEKHGITPQSIKKSIRERILPKGEDDSAAAVEDRVRHRLGKDVEVMTANYQTMPKREQNETLKVLTQEMKREAESLNFERAIEIRNLIQKLKKGEM
ncbi:MAG: excinuclease ABC subunit UvrB [Candidatus Dojkabacteria bacterium]|nr:MAG: excinuclease ABC subunit UvrB [Candidatus Dojkabacteria bacterium]